MIPRKKLVDPSTDGRDARLYIVVVEGEKTEKAYFQALEVQALIPRERVKLYVVPVENGKSAPLYLINNAEKTTSSITKLLVEDETWLVFDVDQHSGSTRLKQIHDTLQIADSQGWHVALSNPCFEVWLLVHMSDDLTGITDAGKTAEEKLRLALGGYSKSNTPVACLDSEAIKSAINRARQRDTDPRSPIPELPGTRVYQLVERLVAARVA